MNIPPGRPYGGVAIVCRNIAGFSYEAITCVNPRIIGVLVKDQDNRPLHAIITVYMPYIDKSKSSQTDDYVECLDARQATIDDYADIVPVKLLGDFNAQLPRVRKLPANWYKRHGFNSHSRMLHDLLLVIILYVQTKYSNKKSNTPILTLHVMYTPGLTTFLVQNMT